MTRNSSQALLIFTRNPELGKCKTRLAETVGERAALEIYRLLLDHTCSLSKNLEGVDKIVYFSDFLGNGSVWNPSHFQFRLQNGNDLGERMLSAFREAFSEGYSKVVIIGSDIYNLSTYDLQQAFSSLDRHEAVLGPAEDGGYYLLGLTRLIPALFRDKSWGAETVLESSLKDLKEVTTRMLPERNDVDRYEDIAGQPVFESLIKRYSND